MVDTILLIDQLEVPKWDPVKDGEINCPLEEINPKAVILPRLIKPFFAVNSFTDFLP